MTLALSSSTSLFCSLIDKCAPGATVGPLSFTDGDNRDTAVFTPALPIAMAAVGPRGWISPAGQGNLSGSSLGAHGIREIGPETLPGNPTELVKWSRPVWFQFKRVMAGGFLREEMKAKGTCCSQLPETLPPSVIVRAHWLGSTDQ